jgi:hypothetical protein
MMCFAQRIPHGLLAIYIPAALASQGVSLADYGGKYRNCEAGFDDVHDADPLETPAAAVNHTSASTYI